MVNDEAEKSLIGNVLRYGYDAYIDASEFITSSEYLTDFDLQIIWDCLKEVFENDAQAKLDYGTVYAAGKRIGCENKVEKLRPYLKELFQLRTQRDNLRKDAVRLVKAKVIRDGKMAIATAGDNAESLSGEESIDKIISTIEGPIFDFTGKLNGEEESPFMGDGAIELMEHLGTNPRDMIGISTGFGGYDIAIGGGLQRGDANFIAARPKKGKSSIAAAVGLHVASELNTSVLLIDTEMRKSRQQIRMVSNLSGVPMNDIKTGRFYGNHEARTAVEAAAKKLSAIPFQYKNVSGMDFDSVISYIRRWIVKHVGTDENGKTRDAVLIYDYFKLCDDSSLGKGMGEHQVLGFQLMKLVNLILKYDISNLNFVQQNRGGIDEDTSDTIAGSDRILMFCGSMGLFQAKTAEEIAEDGPQNGNRKLKVIDSRDGEGTQYGNWIDMNFDMPINRITELGLRSRPRDAEQTQFDVDKQTVF